MSAIAELAKLIVDYSSKNIKSVVIGLILTPVFFYSAGAIFGIDPKLHLDFLLGKDPYVERYKLVATHLDKVNREVDDFERASHEKQIALFQVLETNIKNESERAKALKTVNRNQDIVRALMEFGKYHSVLVSAEQSNSDTQKALRKLYTGYLNIVKADDNPAFVQDAYNNFKEVYDNIKVFPLPLRNEVKIELLNYLTYCSFRQKKPDELKAYSNEANNLLSDAAAGMDATRYRRKYYWVDLSQFMFAINQLKTGEADRSFAKLRDTLNDKPFLKAKLLQHSARLEDDNKKFLMGYIRKL